MKYKITIEQADINDGDIMYKKGVESLYSKDDFVGRDRRARREFSSASVIFCGAPYIQRLCRL